MSQAIREIAVEGLSNPEQFRSMVAEACEPVVLRGLVCNWPCVAAARQSAAAFRAYLAGFDSGRDTEAFFGPPGIAGRYYYGDGPGGFNFERRRMRFGDAVDAILHGIETPGASSVYVGSLPVDDHLPGFSGRNPMPLVPPSTGARLWLGTAAHIACHYDAFDNIVCVVAGTRRFTLYPPEAIGNLYVGRSTTPWRASR